MLSLSDMRVHHRKTSASQNHALEGDDIGSAVIEQAEQVRIRSWSRNVSSDIPDMSLLKLTFFKLCYGRLEMLLANTVVST